MSKSLSLLAFNQQKNDSVDKFILKTNSNIKKLIVKLLLLK